MVKVICAVFFIFLASVCALNAAVADDRIGVPISNLSEVIEHPLDCDGKEFRGYVYVLFGDGFYAFYPRPISNESELGKFDITVLPGTGQQLASLSGLKPREKLLIRGRFTAARRCFADSRCVPFAHPVNIDDLQILGRQPAAFVWGELQHDVAGFSRSSRIDSRACQTSLSRRCVGGDVHYRRILARLLAVRNFKLRHYRATSRSPRRPACAGSPNPREHSDLL